MIPAKTPKLHPDMFKLCDGLERIDFSGLGKVDLVNTGRLDRSPPNLSLSAHHELLLLSDRCPPEHELLRLLYHWVLKSAFKVECGLKSAVG